MANESDLIWVILMQQERQKADSEPARKLRVMLNQLHPDPKNLRMLIQLHPGQEWPGASAEGSDG